MSVSSADNLEGNVLGKMVEKIQDAPNGLDPRILAAFYKKIEAEAKAKCPTEELRQSISVKQNRELPMKFEFKASKRAYQYVIQAIEANLPSMPFATRLYFQKFEEILGKEYSHYVLNRESSD
jgi:hypothetical protein